MILDSSLVSLHEQLVVARRRVFSFVFSSGLSPHLRQSCGVRPCPFGLACQVFGIAGGKLDPHPAFQHNFLRRSHPRGDDRSTAGERLEDSMGKPFVAFARK